MADLDEALRCIDAEEEAAKAEAVARFARDLEEILVGHARRRAALITGRYAAASGVTTTRAGTATGPAPTTGGRTRREASAAPPAGRRKARDIMLGVLGSASEPLANDALAEAVMAEGLTRNAGDKVRRRLVTEGLVRELRTDSGMLYELASRPRGGAPGD